ncbi:FMN-dependent NADH-azoreductase [Agarivorans sp. 1_MG-2023]|uniref:FMN-dependent NADH-azoreductase n=1 Tax=Agarivorans sp. 1_MG-2023 TaxID=3062634 RepID=UPI0026E47896|nr:NAD(P)H-dependent oxidoreductase [Agarivorans sp. 1_MG-2023]MDO6765567.1 NAD(P)H-dependent oxidoreductase [Agarivorans sp. 1_MG-2023]
MKNVLILNSSPSPKQSISTRLTAFFAQELQTLGDYNITTRELGINPPSHLTEMALSGFFNDPSEHNEEQQQSLAEGLLLIKELQHADIVIIGSAMHNHTVTSALKAYIDQVTRPGITFKYMDDGPKGLLTNKQVYVITSAGGDYSSGPAKKTDFQTPLLKEVLGFIGLDHIQFIPAFGVYGGDDVAQHSQNIAKRTISQAARQLQLR